MKQILLTLTILASTSAFATGGITCKDVEGNLEVWTTEASIAGDNVIDMGASVFGNGQGIKFNKVASSENYGPKIYMGSNAKGDSIVLELNTSEQLGINLSTVKLKLKNRSIIVESRMLCKGADQD
jgi:hypothetical protein